jgi:hypothetical protein
MPEQNQCNLLRKTLWATFDECIQLVTFRRMVSTGMLRRVALVRTYVSKELSASFIRVTRIGELGTTLALTSKRRTL